jgi:type IV pilus assembly protein PilO
LAALPRIVTVHDVKITPVTTKGDEEDSMIMDATVKTYNEQIAVKESPADKRKKGKK